MKIGYKTKKEGLDLSNQNLSQRSKKSLLKKLKAFNNE